ncbi:FtsX-like permease family protein [Parabacteroides sp. PF5-9]|uniref:ABC transporter permease n=1 Tax=Parabacteroides sp. PF5-9 TaxID=1742404 RepID=UPI002475E48F|nr:FtsX-like permease family protein [Parabacteroides sp. PF5-9]MDH6357504.1 putative ABC transport system permease protein [Parabacteroides sp. PF5-9]
MHLSFKLIFRSWRRNKTFTVISILSLAVGIACTNLLLAFVIHEYNVEAGNPNRDRIYTLVQDSPFQSGDQVFWVSGDIPPMIKDRYPEVEDYLCLTYMYMTKITVGESIYDPLTFIHADASFPRFFPYQTLAGNLEEALTAPNKIALTEATAHRFFGKEDPIGQNIYVNHSAEKGTMYQVVAVIAANDQSALSFDGITSMAQKSGGQSFLLMNQSIDPEAFALRLKEDGIHPFMGDKGRYYLYTLQESFFRGHEYKGLYYPHIMKQNKLTLDIGLFSALLILLIACFNYINLNFSRLLHQVKMIHVQRLMGASRIDIDKQLFFDTFLTVFIGFLFSLLIMYDLIPAFNSILSGQMEVSFIFSGQVMPVLIGLILILSVLPAIYVSRKIGALSRQRYLDLTGGKNRQGIIATLSVVQFTISIALIIATQTVNNQIGLISQGGEAYQGLIEIESGEHAKAFVEELRTHPELGEINTAGLPLFNYGIREIAVVNPDESETVLTLVQLYWDTAFLSTFHLGLQQGIQPEEALTYFSRPVYINRRFADLFVENGENPIGKPVKSYDKAFDHGNKEDGSTENPITTIAGVVDNFFIGSLEQEVSPTIIHINNLVDKYNVAYFRLNDNHPERLSQVKQIWEKYHPGQLFTYKHVYEEFVSFNQKAFGLADLLLMYSLISIFLTCFGLFGIALYAAEQRTKEIGIRKVNGATTWQIVGMLNKQLIMWISIAFVIAVPVSWLLLNRWLQGFVYRAEISVGIFVLALFAVTGIALLTVSWHSFRAASSNPVKALRNE